MLDVLQDKTTNGDNDETAKPSKGNVESAKESELRKNSLEKSGFVKSIKRMLENSGKQKMEKFHT